MGEQRAVAGVGQHPLGRPRRPRPWWRRRPPPRGRRDAPRRPPRGRRRRGVRRLADHDHPCDVRSCSPSTSPPMSITIASPGSITRSLTMWCGMAPLAAEPTITSWMASCPQEISRRLEVAADLGAGAARGPQVEAGLARAARRRPRRPASRAGRPAPPGSSPSGAPRTAHSAATNRRPVAACSGKHVAGPGPGRRQRRGAGSLRRRRSPASASARIGPSFHGHHLAARPRPAPRSRA